MFRFHNNLYKAVGRELIVQHIHGVPYLPIFLNKVTKLTSKKTINPVTRLPTTNSRQKNSAGKRMPNYDTYGAQTKPKENCRTCTDFKFWSKQQRQIFHKAGSKDDEDDSERSTPRRTDCPLDKGQLGKATWGLIHTIGAFYPDKPTEAQKKDIKTFFEVLSRVYPCEFCAKDFQQDLAQNPIQTESQQALSQWLCRFHNRVNIKVGKPEFDCKKYNQRWRDGWLDGSCD